MPKRSAGILLHRRGEVLLVHPGGPFWAKRDDGAWSIPKGEYEDGEDPLAAARREFEEELGSALPEDAEVSPECHAIPFHSRSPEVPESYRQPARR